MKFYRLFAFFLATALISQTSLVAQSRVNRVIDESQRAVRTGNRHPLVRPEFDQGPAARDLRMDRMVLVLEPSAAQQNALTALLDAQQDSTSPQFHQWMTPEDFGAAFGISDRDLDQVTGWLTTHGFQVEPVESARRSIVFSGTASQVEAAFHTSIHVDSVKGERHYANATDPEIPLALAPVIHGVVSLHNFPLAASRHDITTAPEFSSGSAHYLAPADFATIYNASSLYNNSIDGTGQSVAVVGRSNFNMSDVAAFRSRFWLPVKNPTVILNGADPGTANSGEVSEALLDVEWAGAVAKNASIQFVTSASTNSSDGITLSAQYIVNHNLAPVMSLSFGSCESAMGASGNQFWNALWQQAAAQGITVLAAAGDSGAAGCDPASASTATSSRGVSGLCSSPYSTCVGGTQFADNSNPTAYWSAANSSTGLSALSYIPEAVWNQSASVAGGSGLWAGGGGASSVYSKPAWQNAPGVPADTHRYVPDVSLNASTHDGYLVIMNGGLYVFGGTSASTPSMAGLMALLAQKTGARQGNANPVLYALASHQAAGGASVFHDTTSGNNSVPGVTGYTAGTGFDAASGLGSVDAMMMVNHWTDGSIPVPAFQLTAAASVSLTQSSSKQASVQVSVSGGFNAAVALSLSGAPAGLTASFSPSSFAAPGSGSSTLTLAASSSATPGTYNLNITATSGTKSQNVPLMLSIVSSCSAAPSATSASAQASGGTGSVNITAGGGCSWTASSNASWIVINSGSSGSGNGSVHYTVAPNTATSPRAGTMTIAGATFTVTQSGAVVCTYTVTPGPLTAVSGGYSATIAATAPSTCSWTAVSDATWITIKSGGSGTGNGAATIFAASKTSGPSRTGSFVIAGYGFTLTEK